MRRLFVSIYVKVMQPGFLYLYFMYMPMDLHVANITTYKISIVNKQLKM